MGEGEGAADESCMQTCLIGRKTHSLFHSQDLTHVTGRWLQIFTGVGAHVSSWILHPELN